MSAAQSGMITIGDFVLAIDGVAASGKSTDDLKNVIAGKRGTRIRYVEYLKRDVCVGKRTYRRDLLRN